MSTPTYVKVATALPARERLRREAIALRRAEHPNVVRLESFTDLEERTELCIEHGGNATLLTTTPPDGPAALAFAASLAATLADLHGIGIAHGRLTADHVLVAPGGRPLLCGLSEAAPGDPTADIRAFGALLEVLAAGIPDPTDRRTRRATATLLAVADRARTGEPAPTAAALAALLGVRSPAVRSQPRTAYLIGAGTVTAAVLGVLGVTRLTGGGALPVRAAEVTTTTSATTVPATTAPAPTTALETAPNPVRIEVSGATYDIGRAGDIVVTGDWDCDGVVGVALLRPEDDLVFTFDLPATPGEPLPGTPLATVPGITMLETIDQPDGCTSLIARHGDGSAEVLEVVR